MRRDTALRPLLRCRAIALAALLLAGATAHAAGPDTFALLVGVSEYPSLPPDRQLKGPRNDVPLWRDALVERGVPPSAIRVLADGVPGATLPTRDNILGALDDVAARVHPGDQVVLYFSGHGSQQPVDPQGPYAADEPDGMFETFLPRDVERWEQSPGHPGGAVRNAIIDHELRSRVDRIGARGAFVWVIFDVCQSATLVRGAADAGGVTLRGVAPALLGVPALPVAESARPGSAPAGPVKDGTPRLRPTAPAAAPPMAAYFYAAQTTESTPELQLPPGQRAAVHGLFSYALLQSLAGGAGMSYRQLAQSVLLRYGAIGEGSARTPEFAGTGLDTPVLGKATPPVRQWRLPTLEAAGRADPSGPLVLPAGELHDLRPGAILAILPTPASASTSALGYVRVQSAMAHTAQVLPFAPAGQREVALASLRMGAVARLVVPAPRTGLVVQADLAACIQPCPFTPALQRLRAAAGQRPAAGLRWASEGEPADLRLVAVDDRLWLLPPGAAGRPCSAGSTAQRGACAVALSRSSPSITAAATATADRLAAVIDADLATAERALNLLRLASQSALEPGSFKTEITLQPQLGPTRSYQEGTVPELQSGDGVLVTLHNPTGAAAIDVTVLHLDARYGIQTVYPPPGTVNRFVGGATASVQLVLDSGMTSGLERLVIVAVPAAAHQERADLSPLAQAALPAHEIVRGGPGGPSASSVPSDSTRMRVVAWNLRP